MFRERLGKSLFWAAAYGALLWVSYAQVEYIFCTLIPLRFDGFTLPVSHWRWTALVFGAYAGMGALLGAFAAVLVTLLKIRIDRTAGPALAALSFIVTYVAWLIGSGALYESGLPPIVICLLLFVLLTTGLPSASNSRSRMMLISCWAVPILLFSPFKIEEYWQPHSQAAVWGVWMVWAALIWAVAVLLGRIGPVFAMLADPSLFGRKVLLSAAASAAIFGSSAMLNRDLPPAPHERASQPGDRRPNVLLVIWDTARADHESIYGYQRDTTPFLRAFAEHATLYQNGFSASDMTLSSSASLFTGLYASWHNAHFSTAAPYGRPLDRKFQTVAEVLREQGYTTMAVMANCSYLGLGYLLNQGFQLYDVRTPAGSGAIDHAYYLRALLRRIVSPIVSVAEFDRRFRRADEITGDALKLLAAAGNRRAPFFLTANYMDAHLPYIPPPPYDTLYPGKDPQMSYLALERLRKEVLQLRRTPTAAESAHMFSQYDGALAFMDAQARRLVDGLRQLGLYDSTMIIFTADHGEALGDRRMLEHAVSVYQDQVHIPLVVKYPQQSGRAVVAAPVSAIDVMPTVLEAAGLAAPKQLQGRSLRHPDESRMILSESFRSGLLAGWHPRFNRVERAIVHGPLKFIESTAGKAELYDFAADPAEAHDLLRAKEATASDLRRSLAAMLAAAPADLLSPHKVDTRNMERLRSLGYAQ